MGGRLLLTAAAPRAGGGSDDDAALERILLGGFGLRMVDVATEPWRSVAKPSERPLASALARLESESEDVVTSPMHRSVSINDAIGWRVLQLCDGSRTRPDIEAELAATDPPASPADVAERLQVLSLLGVFVA